MLKLRKNTQFCPVIKKTSKRSLMHRFLLLFAFLLGTATPVVAQSHFSVDAQYIQGFQSHTLELWYVPVTKYVASGYNGHIYYEYHFDKPAINLRLGLGGQMMYFHGESDGEKFTGNSGKLELLLQGLYRFNEKWKAGLGVNLENNRDSDQFRAKSTDNFRYNALLDVHYNLTPQLSLLLRYSYVIYPNVDVYLLNNPANRIGFGINYQITKP